MKIRIIGLPGEVAEAAEIIGTAFDVIEVSDPYPAHRVARGRDRRRVLRRRQVALDPLAASAARCRAAGRAAQP
jgi:hypothetical protein